MEKMLTLQKTTFNAKDSGLLFTFGVVAPQIASVIIILPLAETVIEYLSILLIQAAMFFTCFFYCKSHGMNLFEAVKIKGGISAAALFAALGLGISTLWVMDIPLTYYIELLESINFDMTAFEMSIISPLDVVLATVFMCLLPAICEETLFRGAILQGLRRFGDTYAILVSAALFMLMHGNPVQTPYPFIMGLVLGFVFVKTGNLFYCMVIHFFNNFSSFIFEYAFQGTQADAVFLRLTYRDIIFIGVAAAIFAVCIYYFYRQETVKDQSGSPKIFKTPIAIPGGLVTILNYAPPVPKVAAGEQAMQDDGFAVAQTEQTGQGFKVNQADKMHDDGFAVDTAEGAAQGAEKVNVQADSGKKSVFAANNIFINAQMLLSQGFLFHKRKGLFVLPDSEDADITPPLGFKDVTKEGKYNDKYMKKKDFILMSLAGIIISGANWILILIASTIAPWIL